MIVDVDYKDEPLDYIHSKVALDSIDSMPLNTLALSSTSTCASNSDFGSRDSSFSGDIDIAFIDKT